MHQTSPSTHRRHADRERRRPVAWLVTGALLLALAGAGVVVVSAQLGESSGLAARTPAPGIVLAGSAGSPAEGRDDGQRQDGSVDSGVESPDGMLPFGTTAFDGAYAGIAKLDPALLAALREATTAAEADGVFVLVNSGWRSPQLQERLLQDAVDEYGSEAEAARWVARPETSLHVSGHAVDVEGTGAVEWLAANGEGFGLCQSYLNEPWHFEHQPNAAASGCAPQYRDPTEDPRLLG